MLRPLRLILANIFFLKSIFCKKEQPINSYSDFWKWFLQNEKRFHGALKDEGNINEVFFDKLSPKLDELKDGFYPADQETLKVTGQGKYAGA